MFKNSREEQERAIKRNILEAKILDQYEFCVSKSKITNSDFLNMSEKLAMEKFLKEQKIKNYIFFGGNGENSERNIIIFFPRNLSDEINFSEIVSVIRIELPKNTVYEHRIYLSGIMKLGVKREKIGDILTQENGADIIVLKEVADFLKSNLQMLTRFKNSKINIISINEVRKVEPKFEFRDIIVSSLRLDSFVTGIAKVSRTKGLEIIKDQKVFLNYELETKFSRKININDVINIRGKGKFVVDKLVNKTKSERWVVTLKKYI